MYSDNRQDIREMYFAAWKKHLNQETLDPLTTQIVSVILEHPEYHDIFNNPEKYLDKDYLPELGETNPFLHLGLHLGIREQVATNRPLGINNIYQQLCTKLGGDSLEAEHAMIDCLAEAIWHAQRYGSFDEVAYVRALNQLINQPAE